jgi:hypothetical protein
LQFQSSPGDPERKRIHLHNVNHQYDGDGAISPEDFEHSGNGMGYHCDIAACRHLFHGTWHVAAQASFHGPDAGCTPGLRARVWRRRWRRGRGNPESRPKHHVAESSSGRGRFPSASANDQWLKFHEFFDGDLQRDRTQHRLGIRFDEPAFDGSQFERRCHHRTVPSNRDQSIPRGRSIEFGKFWRGERHIDRNLPCHHLGHERTDHAHCDHQFDSAITLPTIRRV